MKKLMFAMTALLVAGQVNARAIETNMGASLPNVRLQEGTTLAQRDIRNARIEVDQLGKRITLQMFPEFRCPPGMLCAQVMPAPIVYTVSLDSAAKGNCNEMIYTGTLDRRPAEGTMEAITVIDNRSNSCEAAFLAGTEVVLNLQSPASETTEQHLMSGDLME